MIPVHGTNTAVCCGVIVVMWSLYTEILPCSWRNSLPVCSKATTDLATFCDIAFL